MISKPTYLTNAKLEEMYGGAMFWFFITIGQLEELWDRSIQTAPAQRHL